MKHLHEVKTVRRVVLAGLAVALTGCGDETGSGDGGTGSVPTYAEVANILGTDGAGQSSCSVAGCHGGTNGEANLTLSNGLDLEMRLVGVPSCEAPSLPLVDPGNPEGSWLYIKLAGDVTDSITGKLVADPSWGDAATDCPRVSGFGTRMPGVPPFELPDGKLSVIYDWIKGGAPGPM